VELKLDSTTGEIQLTVNGVTISCTEPGYQGGRLGIGTGKIYIPVSFGDVEVYDLAGTQLLATHEPDIVLNSIPYHTIIPGSGKWLYLEDEDGNIAYAQTMLSSSNVFADYKDAQLVNGSLQADIKIAGTSNSEVACLYFRMSSDRKYGYVVKVHKNKRLYLYKVKNGSVYSLAPAVDLTAYIPDYDPYIYHTIRVDLDGYLISVSVDDVQDVVTAQGFDYYGGLYTHVSIGTSSTSGPVWFDNVALIDVVHTKDSFTAYPTYTDLPHSGTWEAGDGFVTQTDTILSKTNPAIFTMNESNVADGTVRTKVRFDAAYNYSSSFAYIYFGMDDELNGFAASISYDGYYADYLKIHEVKNGQVQSAVLASGSIVLNNGTFYDVELKLDSATGEIQLTVNGVTINCIEASYQGGKVGIGTGKIYVPTSFEDVEVYDLPGSQLLATYEPDAILNAIPYHTIIPVSGDWKYLEEADGNIAYVQTLLDTSSTYHKAMFYNAALQEGSLQADVKISGSSSNEKAYLYFRMSVDQKYGYAVMVDKYKRLYFCRVNNGTPQTVGSAVDLTTHIADYDPYAYHTITVDLDGYHITVSVDGIEVLMANGFEYYGDTYTHAGIGTSQTSGPVWFDNVALLDVLHSAEDFTEYPSYTAFPHSGL
jgi:hypothetical protein